MALGRRKYRESEKSELVGFGAVRATRGLLDRRRVGISKEESGSCCLRRQCSDKFDFVSADCDMSSPLEALPQELLIRVLCGVEHDDLKQLILVSKSVMEAALVAKRMHFAYSTPTNVKALRTMCEMDSVSDEEIEAPNAPRRTTALRRISLTVKEDLAVSLFQTDDDLEEEKWPRRDCHSWNKMGVDACFCF